MLLNMSMDTIFSHADDTYVLITGPTTADLIYNLEECIKNHLTYLKAQGMLINLLKTEAVIFTRKKDPI